MCRQRTFSRCTMRPSSSGSIERHQAMLLPVPDLPEMSRCHARSADRRVRANYKRADNTERRQTETNGVLTREALDFLDTLAYRSSLSPPPRPSPQGEGERHSAQRAGRTLAPARRATLLLPFHDPRNDEWPHHPIPLPPRRGRVPSGRVRRRFRGSRREKVRGILSPRERDRVEGEHSSSRRERLENGMGHRARGLVGPRSVLARAARVDSGVPAGHHWFPHHRGGDRFTAEASRRWRSDTRHTALGSFACVPKIP